MTTEVYFATNRTEPKKKGGEFGNRFHSDGPHFYEVGKAEVTWKQKDIKKRDWDDFEVTYNLAKGAAPKAATPGVELVPETTRKATEKEVTGSSKLFQELRTQMQTDQRDVLVYIHGFANSFENSIGRAAQLKELYTIAPFKDGKAGKAYQPYIFAFSWPSDGKVQPPWKYASDREDAALSGIAMARALRRFVDFLNEGEPCRQRLHLVTHSMGNWALRHAVLGLRALMDEGRLPKIFENAFMMAPDEDEDCFESTEKLGALPQLANAIHVYHSRDDLALHVSDKTKGNIDRLGTDGPRTFSGISNRITSVDCAEVNSTTITHGNHQYYRLRPEVLDDVRHVLSGRYQPDQVPKRKVIEPGRRYRIPAKKA